MANSETPALRKGNHMKTIVTVIRTVAFAGVAIMALDGLLTLGYAIVTIPFDKKSRAHKK